MIARCSICLYSYLRVLSIILALRDNGNSLSEVVSASRGDCSICARLRLHIQPPFCPSRTINFSNRWHNTWKVCPEVKELSLIKGFETCVVEVRHATCWCIPYISTPTGQHARSLLLLVAAITLLIIADTLSSIDCYGAGSAPGGRRGWRWRWPTGPERIGHEYTHSCFKKFECMLRFTFQAEKVDC